MNKPAALLITAASAMALPLPADAHVNAGDGLLADWHWRWDVIAAVALFGTVYVRGWVRLRQTGGNAKLSHVLFYAAALGAIGCALSSPLEELASYLLIAHMVQHELLMMVAAPLILLANPVPILLWGAGERSRSAAAKFLASGAVVRRLRDFLGWMPVAWTVYVVNLWAWHYPLLYEAALRNDRLHDLEHLLFFFTALLFWWPILRPVTRPAPVQDGVRIFYLFLAATQDALLSGLIALSESILYPHYETVTRMWHLTPRQDQIGGGIVMFGVGSATYAVAILFLVNALLAEGKRHRSTKRSLRNGAEKIEGRI